MRCMTAIPSSPELLTENNPHALVIVDIRRAVFKLGSASVVGTLKRVTKARNLVNIRIYREENAMPRNTSIHLLRLYRLSRRLV
jgi:hypothetical protein